MDGILSLDILPLDLILFAAASFAAALVAGVAGFAFGLVAAGVWLHIMTPAQSAALIVGFGLIVQGVSVWKLRRAVRPARLLPFVLGGAFGVPAGIELLRWIPSAQMRAGIGVFLILFSVYSLARPQLRKITAGGASIDGVVGFFNGIVGGATGLAGILSTIWCGLRGWPKDEQRAVFQPVGVAVFLMTAAWLGGTGLIGGETAWLFLIGLPAILAGTWLGLRLYGRLDEAWFRRVVLGLLLVSGAGLLI